MDWDQFIRNSGLDRYDRNARLYPALICLMPMFVVVVIWLPQAWTLLGSLVSIAVAGSLIYGLAQIVRHLGRQVEAQMGVKAGRAKSATLLTYADKTIPRDSKMRYRKYLADHGVALADEETERLNPMRAYESCRAAVDWLLEHTRPLAKTTMLHSELIAYGFRRNLLGLKPFGILVAIIALIVNSYFLYSRTDADRAMAGMVLELFFVLAVIAWVFIIRASFVEDAATSYGQRFLAHCEHKKEPSKQRKPKSVKEGEAPT